MAGHNNPNLKRTLDAVVQTILKSSDDDALIAVQQERADIIALAKEHGLDDFAELVRARGD